MNKIETGIRAGAPVGEITFWPLDVPPTGKLICDGSEVLRATYPELWDFVNTNGLAGAGLPYGVGDGSTTFDLPDGRNRFLKSPSSGKGGATGGADTHSHTNPSTGSSGSHSHTNPSTGSTGSHTHTNPSTGTEGDHGHGVAAGSTEAVPGGVLLKFSFDIHEHPNAGSHSHTQGSTGSVANHAHSVGDTGTESSHSHTQADTASESNLPPYLELWMIVAT